MPESNTAPASSPAYVHPSWVVVNTALGDLVLVDQSNLRDYGSRRALWQVQASGEGTGYGVFFDRSEAETVAAFCNLMAKRTGPSNWIGAFQVYSQEEVQHA